MSAVKKYPALTRPLGKGEIEFRAKAITESGWAVLLAYKSARVDMARLDEQFGVMGWQREHKEINGDLFCGITVTDLGLGATVTKWDAGDDVASSGVKGRASDSFKRAGFNFGIGRGLYDFPPILVKWLAGETYKQGNTVKATNKFRPNDWNWDFEYSDSGELLVLTAYDPKSRTERFNWQL